MMTVMHLSYMHNIPYSDHVWIVDLVAGSRLAKTWISFYFYCDKFKACKKLELKSRWSQKPINSTYFFMLKIKMKFCTKAIASR